MSAYDAEGSLLYGIVARATKVLAEYTNPVVRSGNYPRVALKILEKIGPQDSKMTYTYDSYNFHYEVSDEMCFLVMADISFSSVQAFKYLSDIKKEWFDMYQGKGKLVKNTYAMNKPFKNNIKLKMNYYNNDPQSNKMKLIKDKISDVKDEMIKNIDKVLERGEKLDILVDRTDQIQEQAFGFKKKAKTLRIAVFWNNVKVILAIVFILVAVGVALFFYLYGIPAIKSSQTTAPQVTTTVAPTTTTVAPTTTAAPN
ncbi:vesicle-associated membrane protein 7 [Acrasis kona]|uniref:Vesicle-associated membrane protein 7 n=1 Tax=Acrasis kona TaxID=1008807 RepID=A0AAW2ZB45_9EUKA